MPVPQEFDPGILIEEAAIEHSSRVRGRGTDLVLQVSESMPEIVSGDPDEVRAAVPALVDSVLDGEPSRQVVLTAGFQGGALRLLVESAEGKSAARSETVAWVTGPAKPVRVLDDKVVLVVDGDACRRAAILAHAAVWGVDAWEAGSSDEALEHMEEHMPELTIIHHWLPDASAIELALQSRARCRVALAAPGGVRVPDTIPALRLPLRREALYALIAGVDGPGGMALPAPPENGGGKRILVADDNAMHRRVAARQLELLGFAADTAASGAEAVEAANKTAYSLILMDVQMPGMSGTEAAAKLRAEPPGGRRVPIVALTGNVLTDGRKRCIESGMDDFLPKPVRIIDLWNTVSRWAD